MIQSFKDRDTAALFQGRRIRRFVNFMTSVHRRLHRLDAATSLADLGAIPGNRLERLHGDRQGQHNIRINDQWRICFVWREDGPHEVEIVDYH